jgi:hypothetical protein
MSALATNTMEETTCLGTTLPGLEPQAPELGPMLALHRHADGILTFHRKSEETGEFENLFGIRAKDLATAFPRFRHALDRNAFFSVNCFWHPDRKREFFSAVQARQSNKLRYLCAGFADLDCHAIGLAFGEALAAVIKLQDDGGIPPASAIVRSGRGCWLLWFLRDPKNPDRPPRAFPEKVRLWVRIQCAIGERLAPLGADAGSRDALRVMRVPGSINPKPGASGRVKFWIQVAGDGKAFTYSLDELAQQFGLSSDLVTAERQALREAERPAGRRYRGFRQVNARRLREFVILRAMRGGFSQGCRNRAALIYGVLLDRNGLPREAVTEAVEALAAQCRPPLPPAETRAALKTAFSRKLARFRDQTISDWLDITEGEAMCVEKLPPATRFERKQAGLGPEVHRQERYAAIRQIISAQEAVPSCRGMARLLRERQIEVSHTQVLVDYRALRVRAVAAGKSTLESLHGKWRSHIEGGVKP